ncbi:hypothetical protein HIM_00119 [Hirsutella minnesotensis 3608]|nr:hypothetical protein HIM_00119 [Hirsutella minnesotensis 3608]
MRLAHLFVLAGAALSPVAAATPADFMTPPPATIISPPPPATAAVNESASAWFADGPSQPSQPPSASVPNCCTASEFPTVSSHCQGVSPFVIVCWLTGNV